MKGGWRHGVTGVENVTLDLGNATQSVFYKDIMNQKQQEVKEKEAIN
jgi:hypothetical protein